MNKKLVKGLTVSSAAVMGMSIVLPTVSVIAAPAATNGWVKNAEGVWNYYNNGTMVKNGWAKDSTGWCFLSAVDGSWVQEGWAKDSTGWGYIQNGYWVEHAMYAKDSSGWNFIQANGYWDGKASVAVNPVTAATEAVVKAEASKVTADVNAATTLVNALNSAISERAALTTRIAGISTIAIAPAVDSVAVVNANHISVAFTQAVDVQTATDTSNYTITGTATLSVKKAVVQADGKTVILTLNTPYITNTTSDDYTVKVENVKDAAGKVIPTYKKLVTLYDNVKPTLDSADLTDRDTLKLTFSEDVDTISAQNPSNIKVYDADGNKVSVTLTRDADDHNVVNVTGLGAEDEGDYTVVVNYVKDLAGNKVTSTTKNFTLEADNTAPKVSSVTSVSKTVMKVTFSEPVNGGFDVTALNGVTTLTGTPSVVSGTNNKSYYVTFDSAPDPDLSYKVTVSNFTDFATNNGSSYTRFLKFADGAVPALESTEGTIETFNGTKYAVFTFDQDVKNSIDSTLTGASYVDANGDTIEAGTLNVYDSNTVDIDDNQIAIKLSGLDKGDYTVTLPAGFATVNALDSDETDVTFTLSSDESAADVYVTGVTADVNAPNHYYYVTFNDEVSSSALNADNYLLNNESVFSNAVFADSTKKIVKLTAADGAIDTEITTDASNIFKTRNITDSNGNDVADYNSNTSAHASNGVVFTETMRPVVDSAALVDLSNITVTFNEAITLNTANVTGTDFTVTYKNSSNVTVTDKVKSITASGDKKTYTLTLEDAIDSDFISVKAGTSSVFDGKDASGNKAVADDTVVVKVN